MTLQIGEIVADKYRIVRLLGKGGMGEVFEGENLRIRRRVALKTLRSAVSSKPDVVQRFEREAQAAGRIGSEHIVEVLDLGDLADGSRYMVMEFLEGTTLGDRIVARGRIPPREAALLVAELCEGLGAAHNAGIIHRDLKPANVFLMSTKQGRADFVKILDFGVSKFSVLGGDEMSMTSTGAVVGTPYYMSPEQAKGAKFIDARSDLYSVGVILYEAITGHVPFNAETFNELIFKIALETPPPAESFVPDLDPRMASIIRRAMAREPGDRFQSAAELKQVLEAWVSDVDRGVPMQPGAPAPWAGAQANAPALAFAPMPGQPPMQSRLGGTQIMAPAPYAGAPQQLGSPAVMPAQGQRVAPPRSKSSAVPILVAAGILGFGAVSIAAALVFHKKPAAEVDTHASVSAPAARDSAKAEAAPPSRTAASATALAPATPSASSPPMNLDAAAASSTATAAVAVAPGQQSAPVPPINADPNAQRPGVGSTPVVHMAQPPATQTPTATKPGGRTISGSLD